MVRLLAAVLAGRHADAPRPVPDGDHLAGGPAGPRGRGRGRAARWHARPVRPLSDAAARRGGRDHRRGERAGGHHRTQGHRSRPGRQRSATLVHGGERDRICPAFLPFQAARTESGRPRPNMWLSALTAIWISTSWAGPAWERRVSPITRLYRLMAASTPARRNV